MAQPLQTLPYAVEGRTTYYTKMKPKKKQKKLRITEADYLLAQRRASRLEEIALHGKQIRFRTPPGQSKKVYNRKRLKRTDITPDDGCPFSFPLLNYYDSTRRDFSSWCKCCYA